MHVDLRYIKILICILGVVLFQTGVCKPISEIPHTEQLLSTSVKKKDWSRAALYSYELARQYWQTQQAEKAIDHLEQCITYSKKADDDSRMQQAHAQLGTVYTATNNHSKALNHYQKGLKLAKALDNAPAVNEALINTAETYQQLSRAKKSIDPLEELLSLALQQNNLDLQRKSYQLLIRAYNALNQPDKVSEYQSLLDLVVNQQTEKQTEQQLEQTKEVLQTTKKSLQKTESSLLEANAINEMRKLEIDLLSKDKELSDLHIKEQNARIEYVALIRNSSILGLVMAVAMIMVMVRSHRRKQEANQKIEKQNKNISSSINYARRIQEAMLPTAEQQQSLLPDSFVLFKPRDSVSGDFYMLTEVKSWYSPDVVIAAADCTGHGVPGAFMSLIGMNALNGIISRGIAESHMILEALDNEIRTSLKQDTSGNNDGMDIALCIYRKEKNILEFSGAKNPLVYIQNGELFQLKGDVHCIGGRVGKRERVYKQHHLSIDKPTTIYLFSDGFKDQFGEDDTKFMSKRFNQLLLDIHQLPLAEQQQILSNTFDQWKGSVHQTDDVLVIGFKLEPIDE